MRFFARTGCLRSGGQQLHALGCHNRLYLRGPSGAAEGTRKEQRYQALGEYLQRLPRGLRDLLLWSPAIAAAYFVLRNQPVYYIPSTRHRLLSRPTASATASVEGGSGSCTVPIMLDDAAATVVDGALLRMVDVGSASESSGGDGAPSPPVLPFVTGATTSAPLVRVVRDAKTGKVSGYSILE